MKRIKLTTQLNIIFTVVILLTSLVFLFALNRVFDDFRAQQNIEQLESYFYDVKNNIEDPPFSEYSGFVIAQDGVITKSSNLEVLDNNYTEDQLIDKFSVWPGFSKNETIDGQNYYYKISRQNDTSVLVIVFTSEDYLHSVSHSFGTIVQGGFIALILLGNIIILIWSTLTVRRIKKLKGEVEKMSKNSYKVPIEINGTDEITELAQTIEKMRREIEASEKIKQEMLQNISHDFKTPISVIQSYAEAICDGVTDKKEAVVIIKQAELLNQKVKQLLELNKLEYLKTQKEYEEIRVKDIIDNIVNNYKYRTKIKFLKELDNSTYFGVKENFYSAFNNIIDNALRYAKTQIVVSLQNKKLTFFNDGEHIDQGFIDHLFKPYEKGQKGQFGLGMSIAHKTCAHFNLELRVENVEHGVIFIIEPL